MWEVGSEQLDADDISHYVPFTINRLSVPADNRSCDTFGMGAGDDKNSTDILAENLNMNDRHN